MLVRNKEQCDTFKKGLIDLEKEKACVKKCEVGPNAGLREKAKQMGDTAMEKINEALAVGDPAAADDANDELKAALSGN